MAWTRRDWRISSHFHAVRADLLARLGRRDEALAAYDRALDLEPGPAERLWLIRRRREIA
jgi:RNA polymerase sigma-70 factor (ECF subfamily)